MGVSEGVGDVTVLSRSVALQLVRAHLTANEETYVRVIAFLLFLVLFLFCLIYIFVCLFLFLFILLLLLLLLITYCIPIGSFIIFDIFC